MYSRCRSDEEMTDNNSAFRGADCAGLPLFLRQKTVAGLHDFVVDNALQSFCAKPGVSIDLGAGSGALAVRLRSLGWNVTAADIGASEYKADVPFVHLDLNEPDFAARLGEQTFDLVTSFEVIEHLESPIGFLRNVRRLLKPHGVAVITTPNVDNAAARLKFLLTDRVWMVSRFTPEHISPIFCDIAIHHFLPRAGLRLLKHSVYPTGNIIPEDFLLTRSWLIPFLRAALTPFRSSVLLGNSHIFIVGRMC